jgi:hypothetical protein
MDETDNTRLVKLDAPLPCAIIKGEGICGKPTTGAWVWEGDPDTQHIWHIPGLWVLQPICKECAKAMLEAINEADQRRNQE